MASPAASKKTGFRPDIEGLRAFAVLTVVADHIFGWPHGGFLGVDIFFVISGFLITHLMLREHDQKSKISFRGFYARRFRRIFPAATVVLVVTVLASKLLLIGALADQAIRDTLWAFFFAANWHFAAIGTDYFQSELPPSPVQHYWSLSVEEQFYFVWPALLLAILTYARRGSPTRATWMVTGATALLALASLAWAVIDVDRSATAAYFSTFTRVWQLLGGALLAMFFTRMASLPQRIRPPLAWVGLVLMVASVLLVAPDAGVPAPAGIPVVVGALLLIGAGIEANSHRYMWPLTNRVARYLGRISFSLYLWHWPVIVLLAAVIPEGTVTFYSLALGIGLLLSIISYYLVELPVSRSSWLASTSASKTIGWSPDYRKSVQGGYLALLSAGVAGLCVFTLLYTPEPPGTTAVAAPLTALDVKQQGKDSDQSVAKIKNPLVRAVQTRIETALDAEEFPALVPGPEDFEAMPADYVNYLDQPCLPEAPSSDCSPGDGSAGTVMVIGNSGAQRWSFVLSKALEPLGYDVQNLANSGCPMIAAQLEVNVGTDCESLKEEDLDLVRAAQPDLVVIANLSEMNGLESGATGADAAQEWETALGEIIDEVKPAAGSVMVFGSPPDGEDPQTCITKFSVPADCVSSITSNWELTRDAEIAAAAAADVTHVDPSSWVCSAQTEECPVFIDNMVLRIDTAHMTRAFAEFLAPLALDELKGADVLG